MPTLNTTLDLPLFRVRRFHCLLTKTQYEHVNCTVLCRCGLELSPVLWHCDLDCEIFARNLRVRFTKSIGFLCCRITNVGVKSSCMITRTGNVMIQLVLVIILAKYSGRKRKALVFLTCRRIILSRILWIMTLDADKIFSWFSCFNGSQFQELIRSWFLVQNSVVCGLPFSGHLSLKTSWIMCPVKHAQSSLNSCKLWLMWADVNIGQTYFRRAKQNLENQWWSRC